MKIFSRTIIFVLSLSSLWLFAEVEPPQKVFHHPAGLEFLYPSDWVISESTFADLELVPPEQSMSPQGPTEAYFLWGLGLDPAKPAAEQIEVQLKELMEQIASFLTTTGEPEAFLGKKIQGLVYRWQGTRPDGHEVLARIFVLPQKHIAFALIALGVRENIVKREAAISEIFGTFVQNDVPAMTELAGRWIGISENTQSNPASEDQILQNDIELFKDGSFRIKVPPSAQEESEANLSRVGYWYAHEGKIYFVSSGNVALIFRYEIQGEAGSREMSLIHPNGDRQELRESQSESK